MLKATQNIIFLLNRTLLLLHEVTAVLSGKKVILTKKQDGGGDKDQSPGIYAYSV